MSLYDHSSALKEVAEKDRDHVDFMLDKLDVYAKSGGKERLGGFLTALVIGDLVEAVGQADDTNIKYLRQYVRYLYCRVPGLHVSLGRPVLRVIRQLMRAEGAPPSRRMVNNVAAAFAGQLRQEMKGAAAKAGD